MVPRRAPQVAVDVVAADVVARHAGFDYVTDAERVAARPRQARHEHDLAHVYAVVSVQVLSRERPRLRLEVHQAVRGREHVPRRDERARARGQAVGEVLCLHADGALCQLLRGAVQLRRQQP